ncbi:MAG: uracil-DNA glycosylase family protein [Hyphomicrobiaceae bacterium]
MVPKTETPAPFVCGSINRAESLAKRIRSCRICADSPRAKPLPHQPNPVFRLSETARIAVCSQAPGTRAHASGIPFDDPSGVRLRRWMGVTPEEFYDTRRIAILPMGFCFPGQDAGGGDLPPRRECAPAWRSEAFSLLRSVEMMLLIGSYAQAYHLGAERCRSLAETVADWRRFAFCNDGPRLFVLPHPSWRNNAWLRQNPWFDAEVIPELQRAVRALLIAPQG